MKERLEVIDFKYKIATLTFFFFLLISFLAPVSGTEWASYLIGKEGFLESLQNIHINDGRLWTGLLVNIFSYHKVGFNILFALLMTLFVHTCNNLLGYVKNKYYYLLPLIGTLLVSVFLFSYNYISVTATVCYTFPAVLFFYYFSTLWKKEKSSYRSKDYILLSLLAITITTASTHIALLFIISNILFFFYKLKKEKSFPKAYSITILVSVIAGIFSLSLLDKNLFYSDMDLALGNLSKYIDTFFSKNILLVLLTAIPINYYLLEKWKDHTYVRLIVTCFYAILVFSFAYNFFYYSPVNLNLVINKYFGVFATENWYYIFYFIIYMILLFQTIRYFIKEKKTREFLSFLAIVIFLFSLSLILSPIWDEGNNIMIAFFFIITSSCLWKELEIKIHPKLIVSLLAVLIIYYLSLFSIIRYIDYTRENYIKEQLEAKEEVIEVKANPIYLIWRYNPVNIFQQKDFKHYYQIPQEKQIVVKYFGIFETIEKRVKES